MATFFAFSVQGALYKVQNRLKNKLVYYADLVFVLTQKEIKVKYKSSILGYLWSIGHPLAFAFVFFIAFKIIMRIQMEDYALFLITGLFPWQWFSNSIIFSPMIFLSNASIIKKINFSRHTIPFSIVLQDMVHFIFSIPVIVLFMFIYQRAPAVSWLYGIPILLLIQFIMTYGVVLVISSCNLFFRDLERMTSICITLLFYFTPVIYSENMIPEKFSYLINLNPLTPLMICWRKLLLTGKLDAVYLTVSIIYCLLVMIIGSIVYRKLSPKFAEVL